MTHVLFLTLWLTTPAFAPAADESSHADPSHDAAAISKLTNWLSSGAEDRPPLETLEFSRISLSQEAAETARQLLWDDLRERLSNERREEFESKVIRIGELEMLFDYRIFGESPDDGRSLFISMHGGGGAPKRVNDRQWENQKRLYEPDEGVYLAPRAPTDTWNLWHQGHIDAFLDRIIVGAVLFEGVNPDRVYLMGYSAGGDGVFQLAPRMADRFAAAAMMAGHPNETSALGLRNLPFTLHMGADDAAYKRNEVAAQWKSELEKLHAADSSGYDHWVKIHEGKGHWMDREDAAAIPWMTERQRTRFPTRIVWKQDDVRHDRFYWLKVNPETVPDRALVIAEIDGQTISIEQTDVSELSVRLNDSMADLDQPVLITGPDGDALFHGTVPRTIQTIAVTLGERLDPTTTYCSEVTVTVRP